MEEGLTLRDLVLEIRNDQREFMARYEVRENEHDREHQRIDRDVQSRPSRGEIVAWLAAAGAFSGIVFAIATQIIPQIT